MTFTNMPTPSFPPPPSCREDSSIEPPAFRPSLWPPPPRSYTTPPPRPVHSPLVREDLPQPVAVRARPAQSDLSAASTRAEMEPTAVRDLRRVTAPPALMDPWKYERKRFVKSASATSNVTDRREERWSVVSEEKRRRWFWGRAFDPVPGNRVPDRLQEVGSECTEEGGREGVRERAFSDAVLVKKKSFARASLRLGGKGKFRLLWWRKKDRVDGAAAL